ncbi:MAG: DUF1329 domain-containing protein [Myxococcota bacterium]
MKRILVLALAPVLWLSPASWADSVVPTDRVRSHVVVREHSERASRAVGRLRPGEQAEWLGTTGRWHRVRLADETRGFVSASFTELLRVPTPPFREGDVIRYREIDKIRPYLPKEVWDHRSLFFYEGLKLDVGPIQRDYSPAREYVAATERFRGRARLGPDNSLENYTAGQPFPMDQIDCLGDPQAGAKIIWNFDYQWRGDGARARWIYTYWDLGRRLPLWFEGSSKLIQLSHRVEPQHLDPKDGDIYPDEKRKFAFGVEVDAPFEARGIMLTSYRYKVSDRPPREANNDDTWVYLPKLRLVRRLSTAQRTDAVSGTDFTFDDLFSFAGMVPQYDWQCLGEQKIIAPMNTRVKAFPYDEEHYFGPYGLSYADDRWELRDAVVVRMEPKNPNHPYLYKDIYLDKQTLVSLYSLAYDREGELWKIITHNHRWSGDESLTGAWHGDWAGIGEARDLRYISDTIVNVQKGTGNRIEYWDSDGVPLEDENDMRLFIDVGRLTKGR